MLHAENERPRPGPGQRQGRHPIPFPKSENARTGHKAKPHQHKNDLDSVNHDSPPRQFWIVDVRPSRVYSHLVTGKRSLHAIIAMILAMDYQSALRFVLSFSDYERWPGAGYAERWDLRRMEELLQRIGSPHLGRKTAHIAGSKGKGSTSAMIASALSAAGFRTGFYTSPHLHTIRERLKINGQPITEKEFAAFVSDIRPAVEAQNRGAFGELSTFEILTALAFYYFQKLGAEAQVLETGLGGRLDATNVVPKPEVCVLTSISLDHTAVLGDTIEKIAGEKAGIIKPGVPVISAPQRPGAMEVFRTVARSRGAELTEVGRAVTWEGKGTDTVGQRLIVRGLKDVYDLTIPLLGRHQLENAAAAVAALEILGVNREAIQEGLAKVEWPGRMEILRRAPLLIADGAHNGDSARRLVEALKEYFTFERSLLIIGTSADKNSAAMIEEFAPFFDRVIVTASEHPRAAPPAQLAAEFARHGIKARETRSIPEALNQALTGAGKNDLICATGSLFVVAEVIEHIRGIRGERYPEMKAPPRGN